MTGSCVAVIVSLAGSCGAATGMAADACVSASRCRESSVSTPSTSDSYMSISISVGGSCVSAIEWVAGFSAMLLDEGGVAASHDS
jgi:hypothetical protein